LLLVAFLLVKAPNCHLFPVLASVVQGDVVNCNSVNILCPADPSVKAKSQVYLSASLGKLILKCSIARLDRQNRKFPPILIITEAKNAHFFLCKPIGFVHQELRDFVKMTLTRVSSRVQSFCEKRDSIGVTIFLNVTRLESPFFST